MAPTLTPFAEAIEQPERLGGAHPISLFEVFKWSCGGMAKASLQASL